MVSFTPATPVDLKMKTKAELSIAKTLIQPGRATRAKGRGKYAKSNDNLTHLISAYNNEYTLCGDAYNDPERSVGNHDAWVEVSDGPVTCLRCVAEIENCRGVRCRKVSA